MCSVCLCTVAASDSWPIYYSARLNSHSHTSALVYIVLVLVYRASTSLV